MKKIAVAIIVILAVRVAGVRLLVPGIIDGSTNIVKVAPPTDFRPGAALRALGSDYDGGVTTQFDTSGLAVLTQTILDQGFTETEIRAVMGENVKRFLMEQLPG